MTDKPSTTTPSSPSCHSFCWNGISFPIPADWNLASYRMDRHTFHAVLEDDIAVRLEIEWDSAGRRPPDLDRLMQRAERRLRPLLRRAIRSSTLHAVPAHWRVRVLEMPDGRCLVLAIGCIPGTRLATLLRFHFDAPAPANLERARQTIAGAAFDGPSAARWQVYDCAFRLNPAFRLQSTEFVAGRKQFVFGWRGRTLTIWFVSFADRALRDHSLAQWAAGFLNRQPLLRGPHFTPARADALAISRSKWLPLGHYSELLSGCLRYHAILRHLPATNQMVVAVFQHRRNEDLRMLHEFAQSCFPAPPGTVAQKNNPG